jgi:hypothetical protein
MSSAQNVKINHELVEAKQQYEGELTLAQHHGYVNGKNRIPKRLRVDNYLYKSDQLM